MASLRAALFAVLWSLLGTLLPSSAFAKPEDFRDFVLWSLPPGGQKVPVVILIEGNGGTRPNARSPWVDWFNARGVAVAQVRSAASRNRQDWSGTSCGLQYSGDARDVIDLARTDQPRIDTSRFAVMGFSRGGTEALNSAKSFRGATAVHILYGDIDEWGKYRDTYGQCRRLAGGRIVFHNIPSAHHGFDNRSSGTFRTSNQSFRYEPNAQALEMARAIVWQTLAPAWGLPN